MIKAEIMEAAREVEGEDDGNIRLCGPDPFLQPPILKAFFEQLPLEDLAKCRLVSKLWCNESLSTWRSRATLKFDMFGNIVSTRADGSTRTTLLREFLDLWDVGDWGSSPFKQFKLQEWQFEEGDVEEERFLELVGAHVTSLTLEKCLFVGQENLRTFRKIIYQAFPKLQFLKMNDCIVGNVIDEEWQLEHAPAEEILVYKEPAFGFHDLNSLDISISESLPVPGLPDSMMNMLSHFHKLKSLRFRLSVERSEYYRDLLETIRLIRAQDQTKLPLKNFDVDVNGHDVDGQSAASSIKLLKLHEQLNLPLQRLRIDLDEDVDVDCNFNDVIRDILQRHSSTLKYLEFRRDDGYGLCNSFPFGFYLENLKELIIPTPYFTDNLNYLKYTPNLRVLEIRNYSLFGLTHSNNLFSNSAVLETGDWTLPSLTELLMRVPQLSVCNLRKLVKWMPNVERVWGMRLDDVKFSIICENWKHLKELTDSGRDLTDAGVIGTGRQNASKAGGDNETQICPNITKLKNLISFETFSSKLTSTSVRDGFLKLANLESLHLGQSTKIDNEVKAALRRRNIKLNFL